MTDLLLVTRALEFAARAHTHHRRKGEHAEPYVNHLAEVAQLVAEATGGRDPGLVAAALLHDCVEDQEVAPRELEGLFGADVAGLVLEVTDDKSLPKEVRKRLQVEHAPRLSERGKVLKLADKISNLRAIIDSPPREWSTERKREYFHWAAEVAAGCRGVNEWLESRFDEAYRQVASLQ